MPFSLDYLRGSIYKEMEPQDLASLLFDIQYLNIYVQGLIPSAFLTRKWLHQ
jgi:hypothetical protein